MRWATMLLARSASRFCRINLKLFLKDLHVSRSRLFSDLNAVDASALWAQRTTKLDNPASFDARIANADDIANLEGSRHVFGQHCRVPLACYQGATPKMRVSSWVIISSKEIASPSQEARQA